MDAASSRSIDEAVLDELLRYAEFLRKSLTTAFLRADVEWGLREAD